MITLVSTPEYPDPLDPTIISRWVATESEINFRFHRIDYLIVSAVSYTPFSLPLLQINVAAGTFTGAVYDVISVYNKTLDKMYTGLVGNGSTTSIIYTSIAFIPGFDPGDVALNPDRLVTYVNDHTEFGGYYVEARLTINGIIETLTTIASPDLYGYADVDVAGVLRTKVLLEKDGDYNSDIMKEPSKSGSFSVHYRPCWYGSNEAYIPEGGLVSPPDDIMWYYAECVRSEEQGTNLHDYVANAVRDAPFLNSFINPVFNVGLPFDLSFILPEFPAVSPAYDLTVTMKIYNSGNVQFGSDIVTAVPADTLEGFINSLNINPAVIPALADHMTIEIEI